MPDPCPASTSRPLRGLLAAGRREMCERHSPLVGKGIFVLDLGAYEDMLGHDVSSVLVAGVVRPDRSVGSSRDRRPALARLDVSMGRHGAGAYRRASLRDRFEGGSARSRGGLGYYLATAAGKPASKTLLAFKRWIADEAARTVSDFASPAPPIRP